MGDGDGNGDGDGKGLLMRKEKKRVRVKGTTGGSDSWDFVMRCRTRHTRGLGSSIQ